MFELLLFDLDGTLTDPKEGITNSVKYALKQFGIVENDEATLLKFIGPPLYDSFRGIYGFSHENANLAVEKYREHFSKIGIFENTLLADAMISLETLKKHSKKMALATSKPHIFAKRIIEKFEISSYFDIVVGAELDGTRGYKHEVIAEVLKIANPKDLSKVVMIGDRNYDISGAKQCGIASIGLRCGYAETNELEDAGADFIFDNLASMTEFLIK